MNIVETIPENFPQVFNEIKRIDPRDIRVNEKFFLNENGKKKGASKLLSIICR